MKEPDAQRSASSLWAIIDLISTLVLWFYYTIGWVVFFSPFYLAAFFFSNQREAAFQRLNHRFLRSFLFIVRYMMPGHKWNISKEVRDIRSSIIVCNHISYLDPIILISLYENHRTIAKSRLFRIPIFGWILRGSCYVPSSVKGRFVGMMIDRIETMDEFLTNGGNFIVFPEGTRSRDGNIGKLHPGAFKIARICRAPVKVIFIQNTDRMFKPGVFAFNTRGLNTITVEKIGELDPGTEGEGFSATVMMKKVQALFKCQKASENPRSSAAVTRSGEA